MLQSRSQRQNLNQENPTTNNNNNNNFNQQHPTKTPLRQQSSQAGPSKPFLTGGKGLLNTVGRTGGVLAVKDANKGKGNDSIRLFTDKPLLGATSASCVPQSFLSPLPAPRNQLLPSHLRTPAPSLVKPIHFLSPDEVLDDDIEEEEEDDGMEMEIQLDREVEYAGESPANIEQPFESEFPDSEFNFKNAGFGRMLSGIPILPVESYEVWAAEDLEEVKATRFELDVESIDNGPKKDYDDSSKPLFPIPKRAPLASKSTNSTSRPTSSASITNRTLPFNSTKSSFPLRKSISTTLSSTTSIKPRTPLSSVTIQRAQWGAGSGNSSPSISRATINSNTSNSNRPTPPRSASSVTSTSSRLISNSTKPLLLRTKSETNTLRSVKSSTSSLATLNESIATSSTKESRKTREEEEEELGMFGIVGSGELDSIFQDESFGIDETEFKFDLED